MVINTSIYAMGSSSRLHSQLSLISLFSPDTIPSITSVCIIILKLTRCKYPLHPSLLHPLCCCLSTSEAPLDTSAVPEAYHIQACIHDFTNKIGPTLLFLSPSSVHTKWTSHHHPRLSPQSHFRSSQFYFLSMKCV